MKEFELFDASQWLDGIFTVWKQVDRAVEKVGKQAVVQRAVAAAAVALGLVASSPDALAISSAPSGMWEAVPGEFPTASPKLPEVPTHYWRRLISDMEHWTTLPSDDDFLPAPL